MNGLHRPVQSYSVLVPRTPYSALNDYPIGATVNYPSLFTYCPHCSATLVDYRSDDVARRKCPVCGWIQFRNPTVGVAVVVMQGQQLLVGHRRDGGWCIPCGHVEWDESIEEAAVRELAEETGLEVELEGVIAVKSNFHNPDRQTVGVWLRRRTVSGTLRPSGDLIQVAYRELRALPQLKFPTDIEVVQSLRSELGL